MPFKFTRLEVPDVILIEPKSFGDSRGFFMETYKYSDFVNNGINDSFTQDNHSLSSKGVLRGLHYQILPKAQAKLIRCTKGKVFDVAVDVRHGSPTFGKWVGAILSEENKFMLYVPVGFAHGFLTQSDFAEVLYKTSNEYSPEHDAGIIWNDPSIAVDWSDNSPLVSEKDQNLPALENANNNFIWRAK